MNESNHDKEKDDVTGVETTGHEWDGIKELNNPAPRWWLWIFYLTIIWSVGYWVVYPAWPTFSDDNERGGTKGMFEWTQYKKLADEQKEILERRGDYLELFKRASFDEVLNDPKLYAFAVAGGHASFKDNCATCHGTGGQGAPGYPNLNDDDWIWGGNPDEIYQTILHGIRNKDEDSRVAMMPAFKDMLSREEIVATADYVLELSAPDHVYLTGEETEEDMAALPLGAKVFSENCAACHGYDGKGNRDLGAPNLADAIWLKSQDGSRQAIINQIRLPVHGAMPAWAERLDEQTIRQLTIYVHSLGGGE